MNARLLAVVALGGVVGAEARYGVGEVAGARSFPWPVVLVNVLGGLLIGLLMGAAGARRLHPLARPFLGTGVLGGFTTFSTFSLDTYHLLDAGRLTAAVVYPVATVALVLAATWTGLVLALRTLGPGPEPPAEPELAP